MIRTVIVDDEPLARDVLREYLAILGYWYRGWI